MRWPGLIYVDSVDTWAMADTVEEPGLLKCRFCRLRLTLTESCDDSIDCDWLWFAHLSTRSFLIDPDRLMCWLRRLWFALTGSCVSSVDCDRVLLAHVSTLFTVTKTSSVEVIDILANQCIHTRQSRHMTRSVSTTVNRVDKCSNHGQSQQTELTHDRIRTNHSR